MAEAAQQKLQDAVSGLVDDLDRTYMRKKQAEMHRCAAKCCDDTNSSMESVQSCVQKCSTDLMAANNYIQRELSNFQKRLERCDADCQDKVRDRVSVDTKAEDLDKFKGVYEDCIFKCIDSHTHSLPAMAKKIKGNLSSKNFVG